MTGRFITGTGRDGVRYLYLFTGNLHHACLSVEAVDDEDGERIVVYTDNGCISGMSPEALVHAIQFLEENE